VQGKPHGADETLDQQNDRAQPEKRFVDPGLEHDEQEPDRARAARHRQPFERIEEAVLRVVREAEDEVAGEPAQGEEQHPARPLRRVRRDHPVRDQQQTETGIGERRGKGRRIREAENGPVVEKAAIKMEDDAGEADRDRQPCDQITDVPPHRRPGSPQRQDRGQRECRREREKERDVFSLVAETILRVREEDVSSEATEVEDSEGLDPQLMIGAPASEGFGHVVGAVPRLSP